MNSNIVLLMALIVILLAGCGVSEDDCNGVCDLPGWSGNYVEKNNRFTINYDTEKFTPPVMGIVEQVWIDVQTCMGIAMPDPRLIIEYDNDIPEPYTGYILYKQRYIRVQESNLQWDNKVLRHELVHWILHLNGEPQKNQDNHTSPYFKQCLF